MIQNNKLSDSKQLVIYICFKFAQIFAPAGNQTHEAELNRWTTTQNVAVVIVEVITRSYLTD